MILTYLNFFNTIYTFESKLIYFYFIKKVKKKTVLNKKYVFFYLRFFVNLALSQEPLI